MPAAVHLHSHDTRMKHGAGHGNNQDSLVQCMHKPTARGSFVSTLPEQVMVAAAGMSHEFDISCWMPDSQSYTASRHVLLQTQLLAAFPEPQELSRVSSDR